MNNYRPILNLLILIIMTGCKEHIKKIDTNNDLYKENVKGEAISITETTYEAIEKFGEIVTGEQISHTVTRHYNEKGDLYYSAWKNTSGRLDTKMFYKYDEEDNLVEQDWVEVSPVRDTGHMFEESYESLKGKFKYKYDKRGNQMETNWYDGDGKLIERVTFKYDTVNNTNERSRYSADSRLIEKTVEKSDANGKIIEAAIFLSNDKLKETSIYKYNEQGDIIEKCIYGPNRIPKKRIIYENREPVGELGYNSTGELEYTLSFEYKYDENSNWISKTEYKNSLHFKIIERKIIYKQKT